MCDRFLTDCEKVYRGDDGAVSRSVVNVKLALRPLVLGRFGRLPASEFGPRSLLQFRDEQVVAGLTRKTINERVRVVRRAFRFAAREELLPAAAWDSLRTVEGLRRGRGGARESEGVHPVPDDLTSSGRCRSCRRSCRRWCGCSC
ncbi:MAG: hypothetical protein FJX64_12560 [Alphaproteobacteria bacterium]|nr:hypothetical protein [Alphaproteobacteria bacterium]